MAQGLYDITPLEGLIAQGYTLLTPNYRLARRIKAEWDVRRMGAGDTVWQPLRVMPLESWLLEQWELAVSAKLLPPVVPVGPGQVLELWRQVILDQQNQSPDYELLRPTSAAELASQARDTLLRWQVDVQKPSTRQAFELDRDCATYLHWLGLFERRLSAAGLCTVSDCLAQLPRIARQLPTSRVALLEFRDLAPLLRTTLRALSEELLEINQQTRPAQCLAHSCSDKRAELQTVAAWAASLHRTAPTTTIGIVLSDMDGDRAALEYLLRREFDCLGSNYTALPVNFSTGLKLAQTPLVRDALAALRMGLQRTSVPAVVDILRSRFLDIPDAHGALAQRLVTRLYADGQEVLSISDLRDTVAHMSSGAGPGLVLGQRLLALHRMSALRGRARPSQWVGRFREMLCLWGWPGVQPLDSIEFQQLELWYLTLDEFVAYDAVCGPIALGDALGLLHECCSRQVSQPQTADSAIQVLGPLEAAGLQFEHLWVCGMQAATWPAPSHPNPFIPISLQSRSHMPHATAEREWEYSNGLLQQYARCTSFFHASFCRQHDGVPDLPSALLKEFTVQAMPQPPPVPSQWLNSFKERLLEELSDDQAPPIDPRQQATHSGGSSLVEDQSHCPFRAFARHRLRVEPLGEFTHGLTAADRGSLLHGALFALWGEIGDSMSLLELGDLQQEQTVERALQAAVSQIPAKRYRAAGSACWQLELERLASLLRQWLVVERERSAFKVIEREQEISLHIGGLSLQLRVDRVDQLPDGSRVIIDYKSGSCSVGDWLGDRPARPQLLLYGSAEPETTAALAFAQVRARDCRYVGLGRVAAASGISTDITRVVKSRLKAQDWASLNVRWRENLERLATAFIDGAAQVEPLTRSSCTWCGLQSLCRVTVPEVSGEAADE